MNSDRDVNSATPARDPHWVLSGCTAVRQAGGLRRGRECDLGRVERGRVALRWVAALRRAVRWPGLVVAVLASVAGAVLVLISAGGRRRVLSGCTAVRRAAVFRRAEGWPWRVAAAFPAVLAVVAAGVLVLVPAGGATAVERPSAELSKAEAGAGGSVTVTGRGWRPDSLLTLLICGQNMIGGTNSCANADGRAATTDSEGAFSRRLPVAEPPKPCPCVVHVATVTGEAASADAALKVAGHPVAPLPKEEGTGRLAVLAARLDGASGLLTWFGAPPQRQLVLTVGNLGSAPARNPVFQVGTSHGVFAPRWEEQQWRGTLPPGEKVQVKLGVELSAGAHGDYRVALRYGDKVLTEQPWGVGRPWGVTLFWILLFLVVPAAIFRIGMAIVDRIGPWGRTGARTGGPMDGGGASRTGGPMGEGGASRTGLGSRTGPRAPRRTSSRAPTRTGSRLRRRAAEQDALTEALPPQAPQEPGLPWFTPDTLPARQEPAAHAQFSAPSEDRSP